MGKGAGVTVAAWATNKGGAEVVRVEAELRSLMIAALAGDAAAYRVLLNELSGHLRRYFLRRLGPERSADAEDLVQETLMAVHTRRATYDADRPFTAWLHAVARYKLIDHYRQNRRKPTVPIDDVEALFAEDSAAASSARLDVDRLLDTVPERTRRLIREVKIEGRSIAEAATGAGMSRAAVKVGIHRSLKAIAGRIRGKVADDER
jgi:RNA polymerase sigma factor (sigma-70 family)